MAAVMSTADSHVLLAASNISRDIWRNLVNPRVSENTQIWITRLAMPVLLFLTVFVALQFKAVWKMQFFGYWLMQAGLLALIPTALLYKIKNWKFTSHSGIPVLLFGVAVFILGQQLGLKRQIAYLFSWSGSLLLFVIFSLFAGKNEKVVARAVAYNERWLRRWRVSIILAVCVIAEELIRLGSIFFRLTFVYYAVLLIPIVLTSIIIGINIKEILEARKVSPEA
jgi:Na+/proline symporter